MVKRNGLDESCKKIFQFLCVNQEGIGFNRLGKELEKKGFPMPPPTLSTHLKHLTKMKLVTRRKTGKQTVSYKVNHKKFNVKKNVERMEKIEKFLYEQKRELDAKPLDEQIDFVLRFMILKNIDELKLLAQNVIEPENIFENNLKLMMIRKSFNDIYERWLLIKCKDNSKFGKKVIAKLDDMLSKIV